ncbi:MAG: hypothetical protein R3350_01290 [Saprospiraceae bacterium]|nr:hypothetical protein [Saprospiraceae bacterium]
MLYNRIRLGLVLLFTGIGALLHIEEGIATAWYLYAASALLLITHFLFGNVWIAFNQLKRGKLERAEQLLDQIRFPELLIARNRAYYHFARGMIWLQREQLKRGEAHLQKAVKLGLSRETDRALAQLNLAHLYYLQGDLSRSLEHARATEAEEADDLMIREKLDELKKALNARLKNPDAGKG